MCGIEISDKRTYCGDSCKYSDVELNSKRVRVDKNDSNFELKCNICEWKTKDVLNMGGHPSKHLREKHNIQSDNYSEYFNKVEIVIVETWKCPDCEWTTKDLKNISGCVTSHMKRHYNTLEEFIHKYPQYNHLFFKQIGIINKNEEVKNEENGIECLICNKRFYKLTQTHLAKHNLLPSEYKAKYGIDITCSVRTSSIQSMKSNDPVIKSKMIETLKNTNNSRFGVNSYSQTDIGREIIKRKTLANTYNKYINSEILNSHVELLFAVDEYLGNVGQEYRFLCKNCNTEFVGKIENGRIP